MDTIPYKPKLLHIPAGQAVVGTSQEQIDLLVEQIEDALKWRDKHFFAREQPQHTLALPAYWIGRYPVTVGEYRSFVDAGVYGERRFWTAAGWAWRVAQERERPDYWDDKRWSGDERLPVVGTSWFEASAYCNWLAECTGRSYRLPTEAEWERAASGTTGDLFPWGNQFGPALCNIRASGVGRTVRVGSYSPAGDSSFGCADMVGNVSEWTASRFLPYPYRPDDGRDDPEVAGERVTRGGSWHSLPLRARTNSRGMNDPFFTDNDLGFRCACSA